MGATQHEIVPLHAGFDIVFRGFHRGQVIEHIENLEEQLRFTSVDRGEALSQAADLRKILEMTRRDLEDARARLERLELSPSTAAGATERLHRMLLLAEDESADLRLRADREIASLRQRTRVELGEMRKQAEQEVAVLRAGAEAQATQLREACARRAAELDQREVELERRRAELEAQHKKRTAEVEAECTAATEQAQTGADRLLQEAAENCERLEAESEARRTKAQNLFELTITRRRNEAAQHLEEQEKLAKARAEFVVKATCREAQRRIAEIQQNADELRDLRQMVAGQFAAARSALAAAADRIPGVPGVVPGQASNSDGGTIALHA